MTRHASWLQIGSFLGFGTLRAKIRIVPGKLGQVRNTNSYLPSQPWNRKSPLTDSHYEIDQINFTNWCYQASIAKHWHNRHHFWSDLCRFHACMHAKLLQFFSVQFSCSVVSDSLWPHELQHARPPCPSPTPGVHSNSCPLSWWYHPAISPSVIPFSSCPNPSQHQSLFQWVNSSHEVAKVLEFQL